MKIKYFFVKTFLQQRYYLKKMETLSEDLWMAAASSGKITTIEDMNKLLERGADINYDIQGSTVLGAAIVRGDPTVVRFLLDKGAKITEWDLNIAKNRITLEDVYSSEPKVPRISPRAAGGDTEFRTTLLKRRSQQEQNNIELIAKMIENAIIEDK